KECNRRREQDHQPAHRRRPRLRRVMLRSLLPDVLSELVVAQERDEAWADEDRQDQGHERRDEDSCHGAVTPASAAGTNSRPTEREPLTSTTSPGASSRRTSSRNASRSSTLADQVEAFTWVV